MSVVTTVPLALPSPRSGGFLSGLGDGFRGNVRSALDSLSDGNLEQLAALLIRKCLS